jgi:hypothetical protein
MLSPSVDLDELEGARVTVKHDGTCCFFSNNGVLCARRDLRKGAQAPSESVQVSDGICFIPIPFDEPISSEFKFHRSALVNPQMAYSLDCEGEVILLPLRPGMTYELIGPRIQGNMYGCSVDTKVPVQTVKKLEQVPRHYLIEHGAFEIPSFKMREFVADPLGYSRDFIVNHSIEGIVFHCPRGAIYKINRGHLGEETHGKLNISVSDGLVSRVAAEGIHPGCTNKLDSGFLLANGA